MSKASTLESVALFWSEEFPEFSIAASHAHGSAECVLSQVSRCEDDFLRELRRGTLPKLNTA
ncbi:MAG: hypothetical protein ABSG53_14730 [Thermoguttaceae bacterium]